jgi:hypothetical protein
MIRLLSRNSADIATCLSAVLVIGSAVLAAFNPAKAEVADTASNATGRAYLFRGLIGLVFSRGMDGLGERIRSAGVAATVSGYPYCRSVARKAILDYRLDPMPITVIGHSMGGACALSFADMLRAENIPVSLVVTFDPTRTSPDIPFNVERYINIFRSNGILGAGDVQYRQGFPGHYASFDLREQGDIIHINIEKIESIHQQLVAKIVRLGATPANTEGGIVPIRYRVPHDTPIELWDSGKSVQAQAGDTLEALATRHGVPLWSLTLINQISGMSLARGQRIIVPRHLEPVASPAAIGAGPGQAPAKR